MYTNSGTSSTHVIHPPTVVYVGSSTAMINRHPGVVYLILLCGHHCGR